MRKNYKVNMKWLWDRYSDGIDEDSVRKKKSFHL